MPRKCSSRKPAGKNTKRKQRVRVRKGTEHAGLVIVARRGSNMSAVHATEAEFVKVSKKGKPGPPPTESIQIVNNFILPHIGERVAVHSDGNQAFKRIRAARPSCTLDQVNHGAGQYGKACAHDVTDKGWTPGFLGCKVHRVGTYARGKWKKRLVYMARANNNAAEETHRSIKQKCLKQFSQCTLEHWIAHKNAYALEVQWRLRHRGEDAYLALISTLRERARQKYVSGSAKQLFPE